MINQTQTGALLHSDHMATIETLQSLEALIRANRKPLVVDDSTRPQLRRLSDTLRREVESHFGFEENHLFPVFTAMGEMGIVTMLTHEHRTILPLALQVADLAVAGAENGFDQDAWTDFVEAASELVEREIFHIQKEEMGLLSAISALISADVDAQLAETYRDVM